jgi:Cd2+/Zn2+-exporting ATPase
LAFATLVIAGLVGATVLFGMPLSLAVLGHEGSTLLVIANGLRMLHFQPALSVASPALDRGTPARLARSAPRSLPSARRST